MDVEPKIAPQIIHFNRVFHEINHPFWGTPIFGNTHIMKTSSVFFLMEVFWGKHPRWVLLEKRKLPELILKHPRWFLLEKKLPDLSPSIDPF